jgi:hypothetical protein
MALDEIAAAFSKSSLIAYWRVGTIQMRNIKYMNATHAASILHASAIHPYNNLMHFTSTNVSCYLNQYAPRQKKKKEKRVAEIK